MSFFAAVLLITVYVVVFLSVLVESYVSDPDFKLRHAVFWPIFASFRGLRWLYKEFSSFLEARRPAQIAPGVPCPTSVLIELAKASLIKESKYDGTAFCNDKVRMFAIWNETKAMYVCHTLQIGSKRFTYEEFSKSQHKELHKFIKELKDAKRKESEAKSLAASRMKALDGIEELLSIEKK